MIYKVRASIKKDRLQEFWGKLTDGTIASQQPDGEEIVSSMQEARITGPGVIEWFETCYCNTPLRHERETVYDYYLSEIDTELVDEYGKIEGESFWDYLQGTAAGDH